MKVQVLIGVGRQFVPDVAYRPMGRQVVPQRLGAIFVFLFVPLLRPAIQAQRIQT
jgi:hypothetical protein